MVRMHIFKDKFRLSHNMDTYIYKDKFKSKPNNMDTYLTR